MCFNFRNKMKQMYIIKLNLMTLSYNKIKKNVNTNHNILYKNIITT